MNKLLQILFFFLPFTILLSQYNGDIFSVSLGYNYTTSSKIFLNPEALDILDQNQHTEIGDFQNISFDIRYRLNESIIFGLDLEYLENTSNGQNLSSPIFVVEDGFKIVPIEISIYYFLPFSTENFKFFMGGGLGIYFGERIRNFGDINFLNVNSEIGYGIQASSGMDYMVFSNMSIRGEIRFRDPDFKVTNKYNNQNVNYDGRTYSVNQDDIISRINIDGITFRIGASYQFSLF